MAPGMMIVNKNANVSQWSLETGYQDGSNEAKYPIRVFNSGERAGFGVYAYSRNQNFDYECNGLKKGFKLALIMPGETPKMSRNFFHVPISEDTLFPIEAKVITTSDGLRDYAPSQRQCFYQSERKLRFFKMYTQTNCEEECLTNFTKAKCGCVQFSMPSKQINH